MSATNQRKTGDSAKTPLETAKRVLQIEADAITGLIGRLDERFEKAVELLFACKGRAVVTGLGKSGLIGRKIAATFASTGTPSFFLHAGEALHGDLGMLAAGDVLLAISASGETDEMIELLESLKPLGILVLTLTARPDSTLATASEIVLDISVKEEACSLNLAPTASTAAALAMGDALAVSLLERRGFKEEDFAALHPGGRLGKRLRRAEALMRTGEAIPRVLPGTKMPEVIYEMSRKGLGLTAVTEPDGRLLGIITDGDLRRMMQKRKENVLDLTAGDCMTRAPVTLSRTELAPRALRLMEERKITSLLVVDVDGRLEGVLHLHDLLALQLF
jgi:arabinose-5-phosphate isomerase